MRALFMCLIILIYVFTIGCNSEDIIPENDLYGYTTGTMKSHSKIISYKYTYAREGSAFFNEIESGDIYTINILQDSLSGSQFRFNILFEFDSNSTTVKSAALFMNITDDYQNEITIGKLRTGTSGFYRENAPVELDINNFRNDEDRSYISFKYKVKVTYNWNSLEEDIILDGTLKTKYLKR